MKMRSRFDAVAEEVAEEGGTTPTWKARFWPKVDKNGPKQPHMKTRCHMWIGATNNSGYGVFWADGRLRRATHVAFFLKHGRWPEPCALHKCDEPACMRWDHLFEGTKQDNTDDMIRKSRQRHPRGEETSSAKLTEVDVRRIRTSFKSSRALGKWFGVSHSTILDIRNGHSWEHVK